MPSTPPLSEYDASNLSAGDTPNILSMVVVFAVAIALFAVPFSLCLLARCWHSRRQRRESQKPLTHPEPDLQLVKPKQPQKKPKQKLPRTIDEITTPRRGSPDSEEATGRAADPDEATAAPSTTLPSGYETEIRDVEDIFRESFRESSNFSIPASARGSAYEAQFAMLLAAEREIADGVDDSRSSASDSADDEEATCALAPAPSAAAQASNAANTSEHGQQSVSSPTVPWSDSRKPSISLWLKSSTRQEQQSVSAQGSHTVAPSFASRGKSPAASERSERYCLASPLTRPISERPPGSITAQKKLDLGSGDATLRGQSPSLVRSAPSDASPRSLDSLDTCAERANTSADTPVPRSAVRAEPGHAFKHSFLEEGLESRPQPRETPVSTQLPPPDRSKLSASGPPYTAFECWQIFRFFDPVAPASNESWQQFDERLTAAWQSRENAWYTDLVGSLRLIHSPRDALGAFEHDILCGVYSAYKTAEWLAMTSAEKMELAMKVQRWRHWMYHYEMTIWDLHGVLELRQVLAKFRPWAELTRREIQALHGLGYVGPEEQVAWDASNGKLEDSPTVAIMIANGVSM